MTEQNKNEYWGNPANHPELGAGPNPQNDAGDAQNAEPPPAAPNATNGAGANSGAGRRFCSRCGNEIEDYAISCPRCGAAAGVYAETVKPRVAASDDGASGGLNFIAFLLPLIGLILYLGTSGEAYPQRRAGLIKWTAIGFVVNIICLAFI